MIGDRERAFTDFGGLGINTELDRLQNVAFDNYHAARDYERVKGMQNAAFSNRHLSLMAGMANANAEKILNSEADKYTRLEF